MGIRDDQRERNKATEPHWGPFEAHRIRIDALLREDAASDETLALMGVGNANDVFLERLTQQFQQVTLVDCDENALERALKRHGSANLERVETVCLELTGAFESLDAHLPQQASPQEAAALLRLATPSCPSANGFTRTASLCLLSQLVEQLKKYVDPKQDAFRDCLAALRENHFRTLLDWTRPGGQVLLITDIVSADTAPQLRSATVVQLPGVLQQLFRQGNFFMGLHPGAILAELQQHPDVDEVEVLPPWLWDMGPRRFAVCCHRVRKARK